MVSSKKKFKVLVSLCRDFEDIDFSDSALQELVSFVCGRFCEDTEKEICFEVSVVIVGDGKICEFNKNFLGMEEITDCLSFDLSEDEGGSKRVFEVIVNGEEAIRQGRRRGHGAGAELALYVVHGLLHNFGFDDTESGQAERMHSAEDEILQALGYGMVYNSGLEEEQL